ncbi:MAG: sugar phosphate isomerase/epimerase family protein [Planctomycetota bacterium]|jgi:sugar phosphate isomerase/epimerase|nr:sugar phosphate isomerase/epimerase [Planctomycetaceae bacterium]MCE2813077.1 sugar phosphate isomerase/epimerase [Planctomycetaceae bacterium]
MEKPWSQRLSVLELSTMRWSFEDDVVRYRDHGYRAIGIWREKLADFGETKGRELLDELGMSVSSLHWAGGFTGFEGRSHTESLCDALDAVHTAAELQADCLVILAGSRAGHTRSHVRRLLVSALKEVAQAASVLGVELALEPMHSGCARDFSFLTDIPETLEVLAQIDQNNLGIVFDCYHMAQDPRVIQRLPEIIPHIRLVQCGDSKAAPSGSQNRCLLGHGRVPIAPIIQTIEKGGYQGYYEVELIGEDVEDYDYDQLLESSHQTLLRLTC